MDAEEGFITLEYAGFEDYKRQLKTMMFRSVTDEEIPAGGTKILKVTLGRRWKQRNGVGHVLGDEIGIVNVAQGMTEISVSNPTGLVIHVGRGEEVAGFEPMTSVESIPIPGTWMSGSTCQTVNEVAERVLPRMREEHRSTALTVIEELKSEIRSRPSTVRGVVRAAE